MAQRQADTGAASTRGPTAAATRGTLSTASEPGVASTRGPTAIATRGDFVDGERTGRGVYTWADGGRYEGDFVDNKRHGQGIRLFANGIRYEGEWRGGKPHGYGVRTEPRRWPSSGHVEGGMLGRKEREVGLHPHVRRGLRLQVAAVRRPVSELERLHLAAGPGLVGASLADALADALGRALASGQFRGQSVEIVGHTDARGSAEYSEALSRRRAAAVVGYIVRNFALDGARIASRGMGERQLFDPDHPEAAVNRRVEIRNVTGQP